MRYFKLHSRPVPFKLIYLLHIYIFSAKMEGYVKVAVLMWGIIIFIIHLISKISIVIFILRYFKCLSSLVLMMKLSFFGQLWQQLQQQMKLCPFLDDLWRTGDAHSVGYVLDFLKLKTTKLSISFQKRVCCSEAVSLPPKRSWRKAMFSQACFINSVHGVGVSVWGCLPKGRCLPRDLPGGGGVCLGGMCLGGGGVVWLEGEVSVSFSPT